jgi:excisionase family DNA binding protein
MTGPAVTRLEDLPYLLTPKEAAALLRTTVKAIYARAERGLLPGVFRDGRRLLFRRDELLRYVGEKRAPSPGGSRR